jgi:hypothetical protein
MGCAETYCINLRLTAMQISRLWTIKESPKSPYVHVGQQYAGGCGTVV